jgi:hypothetical protein
MIVLESVETIADKSAHTGDCCIEVINGTQVEVLCERWFAEFHAERVAHQQRMIEKGARARWEWEGEAA